jgi:predicted transcriptional regulator
VKDIVISIQPKWAGLIRSGVKTIELRRRFPKLPAGSVAFLYESTPVCSITARMRIGAVDELPIAELWHRHGAASCVDEDYFAEYYAHRPVGYALHISECVALPTSTPLKRLRADFAFTAPQSWAYAKPELAARLGATG